MRTAHKLTVQELEARTLWVTPDIAIYRQLSFYHGTKAIFQFVPTKRRGIVVVAKMGDGTDCKPLRGYIVSRPVSLTLSWAIERTVTFRKISLYDARKWQARTRRAFKDVIKHRNAMTL